MESDLVHIERRKDVVVVTLNDPDRRNAMSLSLFATLAERLDSVAAEDSIGAVVLAGAGPAFCAGFDLGAVVDEPTVMRQFIHRLSDTCRQLRRLPMPVIAAAHGAAIAGGCAVLSACDFVVTSRTARLGYPVHRIGVSPAVTLPTLMQAIGEGAARTLVMGGRLIDGVEARRLSLASHLVDTDEDVLPRATSLAAEIAAKPRAAVRVTKAWLNELDGSLDDARFDAPADGSADLAEREEATRLLSEFWNR